jgi:tellurite resistance protein TehA-like permease
MKAPHVPLRAFVVVMATGILSVGARQQDLSALSWALLVLAIGAYLTLAMAQGLRMRADPEAVRAELRSPSTGFGALALVAATEVIASRLALARLLGVGAAVGRRRC